MLIPMFLLEKGASAIIKRLPSSADLFNKLFDLGVVPEAKFSVVHKGNGLVIKVGSVKLAMDEDFCSQIMVSPIAA
jgi:Fe2+ transport system protein FeoA